MKHFLRLFYIIPFLSLVVFSCKKDKGGQLILWVDPFSSQNAENGQIIRYTISVSSDVAITSLIIKESQENKFIKKIVDTVPGRKSFSWLYEYKVPALDVPTGPLALIFEATDSDGNWMQTVRVVGVTTTGKDLLKETTGHVLYSSASTDFNGFNLFENKLLVVPLYDTLATIDSSTVHFIDATAKDETALSRRWKSLAGCQFVKFNELDYGNATRTGLKTAFEIGLKRDFVDNITDEDIIITRFQKTDTSDFEYAAIKIALVVDVEGTSAKDRYIFNVKK